MTDRATLETHLAEAREAEHQLVIGTRSVQVRIDGRMVVYSEAKLGQLRAYIRSLERQLGARRGGGAIGVDFR